MLAPMKVRKASKEQAKQKGMELLSKVGLADKANAYPRLVIRWSKATGLRLLGH